MKKISRILGVLLAIILIAGYKILEPLDIFQSPKIETLGFNPLDYLKSRTSQDNLFCYDRTLLPPIAMTNQVRYKAIVWNIHKGKDRGWQQQLRQYSQNADFVLLQEATQHNQIPQVLSASQGFGIHAGTFAYGGNMSGVMLLSTFIPQRYCVGSEAEPWIRIPKIAEAAFYRLAEHTLLVINLHLVNFEWNTQHYGTQLRELFRMVNQHQGPIILAGDFNSWNKSRLMLLQQLVEHHKLTEVRFTPDERMRFMGNPLDHVFTKQLHILKSWTEKTDASDHNPLFLEFEVVE